MPERPDLTEAELLQAALNYIDRYEAPAASLRRVLRRRVRKAVRDGRADPEHAEAWVEPIVARFVGEGLVDDARFTEGRRWSARQRGTSARALRAKLMGKGVAQQIIDEALQAEPEGAEEVAAARYARRRRLGPWRTDGSRSERRMKDLAAVARAGFPPSIAYNTIDGDRDELEALIEQAPDD